MDQPLPRRRSYRTALIAAGVALLLAAATVLWQSTPLGLAVSQAGLRFATVERGLFRDELAVRAVSAPLQSVMLDAVESGRVEEVFARDGASVQQGDVLFRLSNPQRRLELLARQAEHAQQISNLTNLRVALEAGRAERRRRSADLAFALTLADKQHGRSSALAQRGFVSAAALEDSAYRVAQQRSVYQAETASNEIESATQRDAVQQMERAIARLDAGLRLANDTLEALAVRAPAAGRLTDFRLQVGETIKLDQRVGRIDDLARFKISADVDEYYLNRVATGRKGSATISGQAYPLTVSRIYPQIKDGRFLLELAFDGAQPSTLNPGQAVEVAITLGGARQGLLLPNDAFIQDSGGLWAFVLDRDGNATRRPIRTGRRNNSQVEVLDGLAAGERVLVSSYSRFAQAERLQLTP